MQFDIRNTFHKREIQTQAKEWLAASYWQRPFAVTLTLKQRLPDTGHRIDTISASQNVRHFANLLSRRCFGTAYKRHGRRIQMFSVLESGVKKRLHVHAMVDCPRADLELAFPEVIRAAWGETRWGYRQGDVQPCNDGWLSYQLKLRDKPEFDIALDWQNCQLNEHGTSDRV
ncbi:hypothetical protein [Brevundimonas sp. DC300-4]|uniref:hypothetical protein n=1 Tax=Brevundimonas sp. DC300-4 TaxID=2804594 RepID=UPI003CF836F1